MAIPGGIPEDAEVVDFEIEKESNWSVVKLADGSKLEIKMEIVSILRAGNDLNTGLPLYMVQATNIIRMKQIPKELVSKKKKDENKSHPMYR
ncbi:MAG: hypothetical protein M1151_00200 [Candidatus Thermoplasmatota archaeon]|jgi:hypothetical protein|nr:hypothetical protein [Candidatus Thermoplasmatota archaeon]